MSVNRDASFILFVYPFLFAAEDFEARAQSAGRAVIGRNEREGRQPLWRAKRFPEDDLLEHVRRYLNPPEGVPATALLWEMEPNAVRLWLRGFTGGKQACWQLQFGRRKPIPFQLRAVQLALFRLGVGFLILEAQPGSEALDDWLDFLHAFRFAWGQRGVKVQAQLPEQASAVLQSIGTLIDDLLQRVGFPSGEAARRSREVFVPGQLLPFATLYVEAGRLSRKRVGELLYRVHRFFPSKRVIHPSEQELQLEHPNRLPYAERIWFTFSLEGGAFVAVKTPHTDFFRRELPRRLREQYFLLFLLALYQRFALIRLSQEVSEKWLAGKARERARAFERIRNALLEFTARGYFTQVMQRENHHRAYQKWQEVFQLERLYQEVSGEVREMHDYMLAEQTRRLERRLNLLGAFVGAPALVMTFLSINLYSVTTKGEGMPLWLALLISVGGGGLLGALVLWLLSRDR